MTLRRRSSDQVLPISPPYHEIKVWHLVYHLAPFKRNRITLHYHLGQLRKYGSLFNGRKILSCMTGDAFLPPSYVRGSLPDPATWEIVDAPNNPLHEATSIIRIFDDLLHDTDDQAFMYAHGKGMSRPQGVWTKWLEYLYEYTFGSFDRVNALLTGYPVAGPFLWSDRPEQHESSNGRWLYPGTFFATRCDVLSRMPWRERPVASAGWLEELPGDLFHKRYLGNVTNAILDPLPPPDASMGKPARQRPSWTEIRTYQDDFWARFQSALAGRRYFDVETRID